MATRDQGFIGYPTNRLLAAFRDPTHAAAAAAELAQSVVTTRDVAILRGDEGARRFDGTGAAHGPLGRLQRAVSFTTSDQAPDMAWYEAAIRNGGAVLMVRVRGDEQKTKAREIVRRHGGHFINYYGRLATEELVPWQGPEPDIPNLLKR